jgi:PAS domain S-box-containing protein
MINNWGVVYSKEDISSILDLDGKKVAVVKKDVYYQEFKNLARNFGVNCEFVEVDEYYQVFELIDRGEVSSGIVSRIYGHVNEKKYNIHQTPIIFAPIELRFASKKGNTWVLKEIDRNLAELKSDPDSVYYESMEKWLGLEPRVKHEHLPRWVLWVFSAIFVFVGFIIYRNYYLEKEVGKRKKELEEEYNQRRKAEEMFRMVVENQGEGVAIVDENENFVFSNPSGNRIFGVDNLVGINLFEFLDEDGRKKVLEETQKRKLGKSSKYELEIIRKDGERRTLLVTATPYFDANGKFLGAFAIFTDITEIKEIERKLKESEENLRRTADFLQRLIESSPIPILILDKEFKVLLWNKASEEIFGWKAEEVVGKSVFEFQVAEEDREWVRKSLEVALRDDISVKNVNKDYTKDGDVRIVEWYNFPVKENGEIVGIAAFGVDLTEKEKMLEMIKENEEKFRSIFMNSPNSIVITNPEGVITTANPQSARIFGENPFGMSVGEIDAELLELVQNAIAKKELVEREMKIKSRIYRTSFIPVEFSNELNCVILSQDVTELTRMNRLLRVINDINDLIVREKDTEELLRKSTDKLAQIDEYYSVWCGWIDEGGIKRVHYSGKSEMNPKVVDKNLRCIRKCINDKKTLVIEAGERSQFCPYYDLEPSTNCLILPIVIDSVVKGVFIIHIQGGLPNNEEMELLDTLIRDIAFALRTVEMEIAKMRAINQLNRNIEHFAILIDGIRNPLAILSGLAEMKMGGEMQKTVMEQVLKIEKILKRLDEGWLESEDIRNFLKKFEKG